jgi:hypothetical protein
LLLPHRPPSARAPGAGKVSAGDQRWGAMPPPLSHEPGTQAIG